MQSTSPSPVPDLLSGMSDSDVLELVELGLRRLRDTTLAGGVDDDALRSSVAALGRCEAAVYAEKLRRVAEIDTRGAYRADAHRSTADWLADVSGLSGGEARQQARVAEALAKLPDTADKLACGVITAGHAAAAARGLDELDRQAGIRRQDAGDDIDAWIAADDLSQALTGALDRLIADTAPEADRTALRKKIDGWTATHDPDAVGTRNRRGLARRGVRCSDTRDGDGLWTLITKANDADKAQLFAGMEPLARKTSADDDRTLAQRRLDALITLTRSACDSGVVPATAAGRPGVLVIRTVDADGADTQPSHLDGVGPVDAATAALFSCDADTTVISRDHTGRIWDVGHADGDPSRAQRHAVIARDQACVGCGAPAARCHLHHIRWRRNGGGTYITNLVLVCWSCHHGIHHLGWTITGTPTTRFSIDRHPDRAVTSPAGGDPPRHSR